MNHVPLGTPRPLRLGPKPPARTTAAATLLFLFFQSVEDILFLAKTKMHRIRMHPLLLLFSRGLSQSPGSLFGSPAASFWRPLGFASPPHDGFAFLAALLRKMRLLVLLSASRASHANIISESQCLGAGFTLIHRA